MNKHFDEIKQNNEKFAKELEEMQIKIQDFNIYEIFKNNSADGGSSDMGVILVQNLEKKVFKKFEFIDEKGKRSDEEIYKIKAEINNLKNSNENSNKTNSTFKEEYEKINNENKNTFDNLNNNIKNFEEKLESLHKHILEKINLKDVEMQNNLNKIAEDHASNVGDEKKPTGSILGEEDLKMMKDNHRKIIEVEKSLKVFITNSNFDNLRNEINKLNEQMATKMSANEISDVRENMSINIINNIQIMRNILKIFLIIFLKF